MTPPLQAPSPTASAATVARRRGLLLVPLLVVVSAGLLVARLAWDADTFQDCRYLGPSARMYVTSWAGLACSVSAVVVYVALRRTARRRGLPAGAGRQHGLAAAAAVLGLVLSLALLATVYWLYSADPAGGGDCSGMRLILP
ncbi:hypothetical protein SAMN05428944_2656 [Streptomyces sp. 1222.5]|uniref:hypothetical protein n=1 Tax=unclassified Streptomyces TaxID=2593676 RepID=UPI000894950B|nr:MULTISPECIES: hypothetical protein [unclassified Streptomyces]PKW10164.1 hypothetical protein BX260_5436 [Streptomyces sp. 5112.2]SEC13507.1 hypothetical protein SAMN05428944_2656 [Streptomyces sp. 1222.5]